MVQLSSVAHFQGHRETIERNQHLDDRYGENPVDGFRSARSPADGHLRHYDTGNPNSQSEPANRHILHTLGTHFAHAGVTAPWSYEGAVIRPCSYAGERMPPIVGL